MFLLFSTLFCVFSLFSHYHISTFDTIHSYQDLQDLEDSISECCAPDTKIPLKKFDTSCFSGTYVTGEAIGDEYFQRIQDLRNDDAMQKKEAKPQSNDGCESVSNDKRHSTLANSVSCESLSNNNATSS